jgi:hypothetical protein
MPFGRSSPNLEKGAYSGESVSHRETRDEEQRFRLREKISHFADSKNATLHRDDEERTGLHSYKKDCHVRRNP